MREPLTPKQHHLVSFISRYAEQHGYSPSYEEIGRELGYRSPATVHEYIQVLVSKGYLRQERGRARSLRVLSEAEWLREQTESEEPIADHTVTAEDVRCARALLELVDAEPSLREEAIRVARDLLGPAEVHERGALALIGRGRERLRRRLLQRAAAPAERRTGSW